MLGLVALCDVSGYELKQFADRSISHFYWSPAKSQVYAELRRLEERGYVSAHEVEQDTRPDKRVYRITGSGRAALREWLEAEAPEEDVTRNPTVLRVFLGQNMAPERLVSQLRQKRDRERNKLAYFQELHGQFSQNDSVDREFFALMTVNAGSTLTSATIRWLEETIREIENRHALPREQRDAKRGIGDNH
ncbi:MAG: PadR family transcriptional regulator [Dehalococcoidia bacterium]